VAAGFGEDLFVERRGRGCGDYQEHSLEVGRLEGALMPIKLLYFGPGLHLRGGLRGHYADSSFGFEETGDFAFTDCAGAYDQAGAIFQL